MITGSPTAPRLCDLQLRPVVAVARSTSVEEAARTMRANDIGCLVVAEPGERVAVVTERDLVATLAKGTGLDVAVGTIVSGDPLTAPAGASVMDAAVIMLRAGVRHLVVTHGQRAVGVVSIRDVLAVLVDVMVPETLFVIAQRLTAAESL